MTRISLFTTLFAAVNYAVAAPWKGEVKKVDGATYQCKCYSDNSCWPTNADWIPLNKTVGGALQVAIPLGAPCHTSSENSTVNLYSEAACAEIKASWLNEQWLTDHPIASLWPLTPCTRGFYGRYVILAKTREHIKAGIDFARERNLRFGSLIINTHSFKDVKFLKTYSGPGNWTGSAAVVGAGVQGRELFRQAFAQKPPVVIVGGECPTVGWAGGYIQGGGHGPLTSIYGMGADSVLSFEAVTVDGEYVTADAKENPDLFWALKGGGPSTFAVVVSITVKTFPEIPTAGTIININNTHTNDSAVLANHYVDNGILHIAPLVGPKMDERKLNEPNQNSIVGGRLFTRKDMNDDADEVADAIIFASSNPTKDRIGFSVGHIVDPGHGVPYADNAINDKWRKSSSFVITNVIMSGLESWEEKKQLEDVQTNVIGKRFRDAGPDGATLLKIRNKWDPKGVLYTKTTPGTEDWDVLDQGTKLCKKAA
ncbi:FAD-binding domain-containing protein [Karstenula rhodostoma CBS 690.94]|uniref:FAD-binding domain-containing protein n=1 Tax=Karstenula rhodostoma CBS 690.94 TaxID=1392251 RepID=A0A9P4PP95_9PLEO|nr:FAD-binding domain-containing protein [Karstenula rhodostoma CBS 690.94]